MDSTSGPLQGIRACPCCGLLQRVRPVRHGWRSRCVRCRATISRSIRPGSQARAGAFALAALILFPVAMVLPIIEIERFGHVQSATIWSGVVELAADGLVAVAVVVFLCSIVIPVLKITAIFALCAGDLVLARHHRATTYRLLEWIGRWGMVDVLLVAVLIAVVKLGNWVQMRPGGGATAFTAVVVLSLLASTAFDPHIIWRAQTQTPGCEDDHGQ